MSASCARLPAPPGEPHTLSRPGPRPPRRPSFAMGLVFLEAGPLGSLSLGLAPREASSSLRPGLSVPSWKEARRVVGPPEAARRPAVQGSPHVLLPFPESCSTQAAETHASSPSPRPRRGPAHSPGRHDWMVFSAPEGPPLPGWEGTTYPWCCSVKKDLLALCDGDGLRDPGLSPGGEVRFGSWVGGREIRLMMCFENREGL